MNPHIQLLLLAWLSVAGAVAQQPPAGGHPAATEVEGPPARGGARPQAALPKLTEMLDVGDAAPAVSAVAWLAGDALDPAAGNLSGPTVLTFFTTDSHPCREAVAELVELSARFAGQGLHVVLLGEEPEDTVRAAVSALAVPASIHVAVDASGATTRAYLEGAAVGFVPYAFLIDRHGRVAWHGHPGQAELAENVGALLEGRYDPAVARRQIQSARSTAQLEATFRDAVADRSWHAALLALNALLQTDAPKPRLLRYKLSILLAELDRTDEARALADAAATRYAADPGVLNSLAWDVVSEPRMFMRAPDIGLKLAAAAYRAARGADARVADTYARALYGVGRLEAAIAVQKRATELSDTGGRAALLRTLRFYEQCRALQSAVDAFPAAGAPQAERHETSKADGREGGSR